MRVAALVSPKSRPKIHATRSNSATATRPQLSPPTITSAAASRSIRLHPVPPLSSFRPDSSDAVRALSSLCPDPVQLRHARAWTSADRRAEPAHRHERRPPARLGEAVRAARPGPLGRRLPPLLGRRRRARPSDAGPSRRRARGCRSGAPRAREPGRRRPTAASSSRSRGGSWRTRSSSFAEGRANAVLDRLLASLSVDAVLRDVVLPYLHDLGEAWSRGEVSVAQEHFASNVLRGRLLGLGRGWGEGSGPHALLACPPREQHDLGLIAFGLALRNRGWRITYLGQDTPVSTLVEEARELEPDRVVVAASDARAARRRARRSREAGAGGAALDRRRGRLGRAGGKGRRDAARRRPGQRGGAADPRAPSRRSSAAVTSGQALESGSIGSKWPAPSSVTSSASPPAAST